MKILLVLCFCCMCSTSTLKAQWIMMRSDADTLVQMGATMIYNMEFDAASALFKKVINLYPKNYDQIFRYIFPIN